MGGSNAAPGFLAKQTPAGHRLNYRSNIPPRKDESAEFSPICVSARKRALHGFVEGFLARVDAGKTRARVL